ncbi:MAG: stearoyl-CoA 9-desaturase, partial [Actinomycetota bacterium]|nr:stearoyl-CoA 9-desaturase [Actinomycetota bacterium]
MSIAQPPSDLSPKFERAVARGFMGRVQWEMILIGIGQSAAWITILTLTVLGVTPIWLGFAVATLCMCMAYLPSHEGQHGNLSGRQDRWRWIDPVVG